MNYEVKQGVVRCQGVPLFEIDAALRGMTRRERLKAKWALIAAGMVGGQSAK